jgi:hypothetical protein
MIFPIEDKIMIKLIKKLRRNKMKKMLIFLTILMFTASAFAVDNNNVASFTEWMQINGYTPSFTILLRLILPQILMEFQTAKA